MIRYLTDLGLRQTFTIRRGSVFGVTQRQQRQKKQTMHAKEGAATVGWKKHNVSSSLLNRWMHNLKEDDEPVAAKQLTEVAKDVCKTKRPIITNSSDFHLCLPS